MAVTNLPATRFGDTATLPSHACGCEQLTNDEVWRHDYVTIASLWLRATYQRRGLGTRLHYRRKLLASDEVWGHDYVTIASLWLRATYQRRGLGTLSLYHRKLVAVCNLLATRFGDTITLPSQACGCEQLEAATGFGDTIALPSQACRCEQLASDEVWGHVYVTITSLWL